VAALHTVLFDELWRAGVRHIFGIPGDFILNLYEALQADGRFDLVRLGHEPAVGFAADGAARITAGLGVCAVTYGAGGLNMVNAVACAYAEESPLVVITGGPGRVERRSATLVHHEVKSFESQLRIYQELTEYAAILDDPRTATAHIRRAIEAAQKTKRPVYLEIPRDMVFTDVDVPPAVEQVDLAVDQGAVDEAAREIVARLSAATRPVLVVGVEVHRFQLRDQVLALAERLGVPVASSFLGRGVFPTTHPQFVGTYLGVVSPPALRTTVEESDCVLLLGELISDTSLGVSADALKNTDVLIAVARDVYIGHHRYQDTPLTELVPRLLAAAAHRAGPPRGGGGGGAASCRPKCSSPFPTMRCSPCGMSSVCSTSSWRRGPTCRSSRTRATRSSPPSTSGRTRSSRRPTMRRWGSPCRRRSACRSRAGGARSCSSATTPSR
jgi:indolepyruvate decarboxylase